MADSWMRNVNCRFFKNGNCRDGPICRFKHVITAPRSDTSMNESNVSEDTGYCEFFKQGTCRYGNRCHFIHGSPNNQSGNSSTDSTSKSEGSNEVQVLEKAMSIVDAEWANAPEFIPSASNSSINTSLEEYCASGTSETPLTYAQALNPSSGQQSQLPSSLDPLCPYAEATGVCKKSNCPYVHGDICDMCTRPALHPANEEQRKKHHNACLKQHELNMELSFAIQRSREKSCGVCFETIMEKSTREQRFGILPNCNHCFCLSCIRKWRKAKQFENKIIRACPECRVPSDFVCPSMFWVDTKEEKDKLITDYKEALSTKDCKYFNKGSGKCPFGNKCFYLHALPDGTKTDVGPPARMRRNADNDLDFLRTLFLFDFLDEREGVYYDFQDIINMVSDSDSETWSEYDGYDLSSYFD
ncbi:probable E3 ubiquitin-protein ligase makorin-1 [Trichogramma pretiosum]|uniref:probable E3 ubiquitin-protein ligase makorin-1 n=1 Tax=Trichogramma pretiosum TaxID=7493 RepID=UPI0006C98F8D|nr:probable E3 ubiquitin-protein ligase makorin-1 [Trichogramma pretiosum]